ncbi:MAG: ATP phosphoribosyltransferase regulatory subunit [Oscillospiraceae bacterium]|jgi:ATP phosphoribosyltransferase regulatory subunit|nr:ATP phosphoribosyltransferase regulatory subunit [Oscillospiraceae bacterium]
MQIPDEILTQTEKHAFALRSLFHSRGFERYEMSRFEEYELYSGNRDFLPDGGIITFTDSDGRLLALRPDVTLSIVKDTRQLAGGVRRVYYHENVYRRGGLSHEFSERPQCGVELIGSVGTHETGDIVALAADSLAALGLRGIIDISHVGFAAALLDGFGVTDAAKSALLTQIAAKNVPGLRGIAAEIALTDGQTDGAATLASLYGTLGETRGVLQSLVANEAMDGALGELIASVEIAERASPGADIRVDFSLSQDVNYYSGIVFQGAAEGLPVPVLSGGRYDGLLRRMGKPCGAIGFSVYIDELRRYEYA